MSAAYRPHCNRRHVERGETVVTTHRLDELERKERAHDDYLHGVRTVRLRGLDVGDGRWVDQYRAGYGRALVDLAEAIVRAQAQRV